MTRYELLDLIRNLQTGTSEKIWVKGVKIGTELPGDMWKIFSAGANSPGGGIIILGLDEERQFEISGVRRIHHLKEEVETLCSQMSPKLEPLIQEFQVERKDLLAIEIGELSPDCKPCYYRGKGIYTGSWIRTADRERPLSSYEIHAISENFSSPKYDEEPIEGTSIRDLDSVTVKNFTERMRNRPGSPFGGWTDLEILEASKVLVKDRLGKNVVSMAGWLCFATYPQKLFPSICITLMRFPTAIAGEAGPGGERFLDNVKIEGSIPQMVFQTINAAKRNMQRRDIVRGMFREEKWEYPEEIIREGVVNALGHRDYSPQARVCQIQVLIFPDRLEIISPGGIYGAVLPEDLGQIGIQSSRNEVLMNILENLSAAGGSGLLCENRGSGLAAVLSECRKDRLSPPVFKADPARFRFIISNKTLFDVPTLEWLDKATGGMTLSENQRYALAHVKHTGWINNGDYCRLTGVDSRVATRELAELVNVGLLDKLGSSRWSTYQLAIGHEDRRQTMLFKGDTC